MKKYVVFLLGLLLFLGLQPHIAVGHSIRAGFSSRGFVTSSGHPIIVSSGRRQFVSPSVIIITQVLSALFVSLRSPARLSSCHAITSCGTQQSFRSHFSVLVTTSGLSMKPRSSTTCIGFITSPLKRFQLWSSRVARSFFSLATNRF